MFWKGRSVCEEFALHVDICNLGSCFLVTDSIGFLQSPGARGHNVRPTWLSYINRSLA